MKEVFRNAVLAIALTAGTASFVLAETGNETCDIDAAAQEEHLRLMEFALDNYDRNETLVAFFSEQGRDKFGSSYHCVRDPESGATKKIELTAIVGDPDGYNFEDKERVWVGVRKDIQRIGKAAEGSFPFRFPSPELYY